MFQFSRKKIVLDCFTESIDAAKYAPVDLATKYIPEWWKKLPKENNENFFPTPTMKTCAGFIDYYRNSVVIPLWSELHILINSDKTYKWQFSDGKSIAVAHPTQQMDGMLNSSKLAHLKLISPWLFKTKQDIGWVWSYPSYSYDKPEQIIVMSGIVNYTKQQGTDINILINTNENIIKLPFGQPLVHITPLTEHRIIVRRHVVDEKEYKKLDSKYQPTFINKYKNTLHAKTKFNKCPYKTS